MRVGSKPPKARMRFNSRFLPLVVGVLLFLKLVSPYRGWLILLIGLGGAWFLAYLWARSLARGLKFRREIRYGWAQVGDHLNERFTLENSGWAPALWVEVEDHSTIPGYQASRVIGVEGQGSHNSWQIAGICQRRGVFELGPTTIRTGDPFGIYSVVFEYLQSTPLVVTPPILSLPTIRVSPMGRVGEGWRQIDALERSVSSAGLREYAPGDSLRRIHWPTTAHQGSLHVRLQEGVASGDWWIVLNLDENVQAGEGFESTHELGIILAASLVDTGIREKKRVGLVTAGENVVWLPPKVDMEHRLRILRELALVEPGPCTLPDLLHLAKNMLKRLPYLIIITPPADGVWINDLIPLLRRSAVATVLLLDPLSFGGVGDVEAVTGILSHLGVQNYIVGSEMLSLPEAKPGRRGQWEWKIGASGRAIPIQRPDDIAWKQLA
ncbi:MAG: DUF58 domain-containing protein [Anaerolineales bacterium]|nr:DUF58 domain-containing protein [Anaerolineales bacterium]